MIKLIILSLKLEHVIRTHKEGDYWQRKKNYLYPTKKYEELSKTVAKLRYKNKRNEAVYKTLYQIIFKYMRIKRRIIGQ